MSIMAKVKSVFVCNECGYESAKWMGKCPACNAWNCFFEEKLSKGTSSRMSAGEKKKSATPLSLNKVSGSETTRMSTGFNELDMVLGGGIVIGSLVLLGGEPGIGKSTLILQICEKLKTDGKILYISGEESAEQIKLRADRLKVDRESLLFLGETDIDVIEEAINNTQPKLVIIDSIQTIYSEEITSAPGSVSQVREITARIMKLCKANAITTIIIGHVTKDGNIAGPRVLEHMVDVVLYLEGERYFSYRVLRGVKNRFGSTNEIGLFEMADLGLKEIENPSSVMISEREDNPAGSIVVATIEGTRPLLVEFQALTSQTIFGFPRRTANGLDYNRLTILIAVLEKKAGLNLGNQDVYMNVVNGIKVNEPAIDLGIVLAAASSYRNVPISKDVVAIGEVGLTGEVRNVNLIEKRLKEAEKLGFTTCIIPETNKKYLKEKFNLKIIGVKNVNEAMKGVGLK
jgi:DNA repair protein RadA/Sms